MDAVVGKRSGYTPCENQFELWSRIARWPTDEGDVVTGLHDWLGEAVSRSNTSFGISMFRRPAVLRRLHLVKLGEAL